MFVTPSQGIGRGPGRAGRRYRAPDAAQQVDQGVDEGARAALEAARRAGAGQVAHEEPQVEAADLHEQTLQDVSVAALVQAAHPVSLIELGVGAFQSLTALPQQPLAARTPRIRRRLA